MLGGFRSNSTRVKKVALILFMNLGCFIHLLSQVSSFNFRHLTSNEGLSDGMVFAFTQDKYGFIWIGTKYGLNRFDGINIKNWFYNPGSQQSLPDNSVSALYNDSKGDLWIGTAKGLCRYDYENNRFIHYSSIAVTVYDALEDKRGNIWLGTSNGLWKVNRQKQSIEKFVLANDSVFNKNFQCPIRQIISSRGDDLYFASDKGIKIFNPVTYAYREIRHNDGKFSITNDLVASLAFDLRGNLWASCTKGTSMLNKIDLEKNTVKHYTRSITSGNKIFTNSMNRILVDKKGRLWAASTPYGLSLYDEATDSFIHHRANAYVSNGILSNHNSIIYEDHQGVIWIGAVGYGVCYFHPDKSLFSNIFPLFDEMNSLPDIWCRVACEDNNNELWLGTGGGLIKYNRDHQTFKTIRNEGEDSKILHYNSIRSLLKDDEGDIWIGTARGLNRYRSALNKIDFFDQTHGIPLSFFWMIAKDQRGTVWLGSTRGLYRYQRDSNRFDDLKNDPVLSKYAHKNIQALYADSRNRLWIGILNMGLVMYDVTNNTQKLLTIKDSLITDTRFSSFAEDNNGIIWIGSEFGLVAYDPQENCSRFFTHENGLSSDRTNNIMVDAYNRIWIGTSNGLCMLSADRERIKRFDVSDGLLTTQFNEQAAYKTYDGLFVYPAYGGFLVFRPEEYRENVSTIPIYITSINVPGRKNVNNTESLQQLSLRYNQNFFSLELAGLNYVNAQQCRYAYKLEPFEEEWKFTSKREINYTNVPAGTYSFRYKVITDNADWNVPEKVLAISIGQVFYRTWGFRLIILFVIGAIITAFFRYRIRQREKLLLLQNKAQRLEKEKALVQFENLKQQLNPHFLFNSLTSLRSLIRTEPKAATGFLDGLSKTYRYLLNSNDCELVTLSEELNFIETFTALQKTRYKDGLHINIRIDPAVHHKYIVPVTLQNLVENAIKHNATGEDSPLVIDIYTEAEYVVVRNNLQRYRFVETSNKRGLESMRSLYRYLSDKPLEISEDENYFMVKIPLI